MFPETKSRVLCYIFRLSLKQSYSKNNNCAIYPGRDTFEYDQEHVTKSQPITVLVMLSESLGI